MVRSTQARIWKAKSMAKVISNGPTEAATKATFIIMRFMGKAATPGQMVANTQDIGSRIE